MIKNIAFNLYGSGIVISSLIEMRNVNIELDKKTESKKANGNKNTDYTDYTDYTMTTIGGMMIGATNGVFWPITLIGRVLTKI